MDDVAARLFVREASGEAVEFLGWEVRDGAALDAIGARLEAHGFATALMTRDLAEQRFHGQRLAETDFMPGRAISGFRTGALGMGRHHSLALIENGQRGVHHLMMEVRGLDDLGQGYDLAQLEPGRVATTLGRHCNDHMTSFYVRSPSKFLIEYGWGGRNIDPAQWQPAEMTLGPSLWGHDRDWVSGEIMQEARRLRMAAAASGLRAPLAATTDADSMPRRHQSPRR